MHDTFCVYVAGKVRRQGGGNQAAATMQLWQSPAIIFGAGERFGSGITAPLRAFALKARILFTF